MPEQVVLPQWLHKPMPETMYGQFAVDTDGLRPVCLRKDDLLRFILSTADPALVGPALEAALLESELSVRSAGGPGPTPWMQESVGAR